MQVFKGKFFLCSSSIRCMQNYAIDFGRIVNVIFSLDLNVPDIVSIQGDVCY